MNRRLLHFRRERLEGTVQYHAVDKRGWMYLCGCMRSVKGVRSARSRKWRKNHRWGWRHKWRTFSVK
jgi:hypothetical protein